MTVSQELIMQTAATSDQVRIRDGDLDRAMRRMRTNMLTDRTHMAMPSVNAMHDDTLTLGQCIADAMARTWDRGASSLPSR
jgi:hypothetical protein